MQETHKAVLLVAPRGLSVSHLPLPLLLPLPLPLPLPMPLPFLFPLRTIDCHRTLQSETATAAKRSRNCGQSRLVEYK